MLKFKVDQTTCTKCKLCALDCPSQIIEMPGDSFPAIRPENEARCLRCQHCLALCPTAAISILGRDPADSISLAADSFPTLDQMIRLVKGRRSVRRYRDQNVEPVLLRQILTALTNAPTGVNRMAVTYAVIDDKEAMQRFRVRALTRLAEEVRAGRVPERYAYLNQAVPAWFEHKVDVIFRGAPHLLAVAAGPEATCPKEDVNLTLAYFELMAACAGLGTVWCGLAKMTLELLPELKADLGMASDRFYYTMLFGVPAVRYARTVQRDDTARSRRVRV